MKWHYYLHVNGNLIGKNPAVVDSDPHYFDGPFVVRHWCIETKNRAEAWNMILEALALGGKATVGRVRELCTKWKLTKADSFEFFTRIDQPTALQKAGLRRFLKRILGIEEDRYFKEFEKWEEKKEAQIEGK